MRVFSCIAILFLGPVAIADGENSGWNLSLTCSAVGTSGAGSFAASRGGDFTATGTRTCNRIATHYTRLYFTSYTGTAPHARWWDPGATGVELFSVHTGDLLIVPPILETEFQPIFAVDTACPESDETVNWIFVQWNEAELNNLESFYVIGTSEITSPTGASTITAQYDVDGSVVFTGASAIPSNACVNGVMTNTGLGEEDATTYFTSDGAGTYKSSTGRATFFLPQQNVTLTDLGSLTYQGIQFDSLASNGVDDVRHVRVTSNAAGTVYTIQPYQVDMVSGTIDSTFTDTITIAQANTPQDGMLLGTVTRTGAGAGGPTNIACITHAKATKGRRVICSGQSPSDPTIPYSVTFVETETTLNCPAGYVYINANPEVGVDKPFCVAKYEMKNDGTNNAVSTAAGSPWVGITRDDNGGTPGAITRCQNIGTGYDLISNAQWQAVAREIEIAQSNPGVYLNWSNNSITGDEALNRGHSDHGPGQELAASANDSDAYYCTNNDGCTNNTTGIFSQKRTHMLLGGEVIWDLAGNAVEWVKDDYSSAEGNFDFISQEPWNGTTGTQAEWGPSGTYTGKIAGEAGGLGYGNLGLAAGGLTRGGDWGAGVGAGVFTMASNPPLFAASIGFRCSFVP